MKVLIISYHYLPFDVIASYRAKAYLDYFSEMGIFPTLITHDWEKIKNKGNVQWRYDHNKDIVSEKEEKWQIYRVPGKFSEGNIYNRFTPSRLLTLHRWTQGDLDNGLQPSYLGIKTFLFRHLRFHSYDMIISIYSPHNHLKLAYEIKKAFGIPYILDFRDLWNNNILKKNYRPALLERIQNEITKYWWNKWIKDSEFITITSQVWLDKMQSLFGKKGHVIANGYEEIKTYKQTDQTFRIGFAGSLYKNQNIDIFLQGANDFIHNTNASIEIVFLGLSEKYRPGISEYLRAGLPEKNLRILKRQPKPEVLSFLSSCNILYYPAFDTIEGWCSGKVYDYLSVCRTILVAPGDNGIVDSIITDTGAGFIADSPKEVTEFLIEKYRDWKKGGSVVYKGDLRRVSRYSRKEQVKKLGLIIKKVLLEVGGEQKYT